jgi:hypothetical protein
MTTSKRKIKAKPFVRDLRKGMGDRELMEKYVLSESQFQKVIHKLVDAGAIDEMELFMRTSLSDSAINKVFVNTQLAMEEMDLRPETTSHPDLESRSDISITEKMNTTSGVFRRMFAKLGGAGS